MKIAIRADSGSYIGSGHIMRTLTLASELRNRGHQILFLSKPHDGHVLKVVEDHGFEVARLKMIPNVSDNALPHSDWLGGTQLDDAKQCIEKIHGTFGAGADLVVVDHYGIDELWERYLESRGSHVFVIDDLADRRHCCNLLMDQTYDRKATAYSTIVPDNCKLLLGSQFAMLREEFSVDKHEVILSRQQSVNRGMNRVLVMMGGTDHLDITSRVLTCLKQDSTTERVTVVLGPTAVHRKKVAIFCEREGFELKVGVSNVAELMLENDICFGAAGTSSWERCAVGMPSLLVAFADNQRLIAENLASKGVIRLLPDDFDIDFVLSELRDLRVSRNYLDTVSNCLEVCDGHGVKRVIEELFNERD